MKQQTENSFPLNETIISPRSVDIYLTFSTLFSVFFLVKTLVNFSDESAAEMFSEGEAELLNFE